MTPNLPLSPASRALLIAIFALALAAFGIRVWRNYRITYPGDYNMNYAAAQHMLRGESVYNLTAADRFSVPAAPPSVFLVYAPFTLWPRDESVWIYRGVLWALALGALALTAGALPPERRIVAFGAGVLMLLTFYSFILSFQNGQFHAWEMLGLGLALWAARRERWGLAGAGLGWTVMLRVSPVLLLLYCALIRRWRALWSAAAVMLVMALLPMALGGRADDWRLFVVSVPRLSGSTLAGPNQSLPAYVARWFTAPEQINLNTPLGAYALIGYAVAGAGLLAVWLATRRGGAELHARALSVLIFIVLLAGPYNFVHYTDWAIIGLMTFAHPDFPARWRWLAFVSVVLLALPPPVPEYTLSAQALAEQPWLRLITGSTTVGYAACAGLGLAWLWRRDPAR